jgi:zinc transport system ATP-binding protein
VVRKCKFLKKGEYMDNKNTVLHLKNIHYKYNYDTVLENISFTVNKGDFLAIVGPNGSGKSTLLKLILRLLKKQDGDILIYGKSIEQFTEWEKVGFVSQKANAFNSGFPATVFEVVRSGLTKKSGLFRSFPKDTKKKVKNALELVDMEDFASHNIGELSGGQQQRVFIARAIVSDPELLILDEPTVGIDTKRVASFYKLLDRLNKEQQITLIIVTHDLSGITERVSHVVSLNRHVHFYGTSSEFEEWDKEKMYALHGVGLKDGYGNAGGRKK